MTYSEINLAQSALAKVVHSTVSRIYSARYHMRNSLYSFMAPLRTHHPEDPDRAYTNIGTILLLDDNYNNWNLYVL